LRFVGELIAFEDICAFDRIPLPPDSERYRLLSRALAILVSPHVR
jgi:hypothetical protein